MPKFVRRFALALLLSLPVCAQELLSNPGLESGLNTSANWSVISWGSPTPAGKLTKAPSALEGNRAQRLEVTGTGNDKGWIFQQGVNFEVGKVYRGTVWLKAPESTLVQVVLRRSGPYYEAAAVSSVKVGPSWTRVSIDGGFSDTADVPGFFGIVFRENGIVDVDSASITTLPAPALHNLGKTIPSSLFGLHFNRYGRYTDKNWPNPGFGSLRLWDCGTQWRELETARGTWKWTLFDNLVTQAQAHGQQVIYTMGQTPRWASARPTETGAYAAGASAEPANLADWGNYVASVAKRYSGRIAAYELWNESDQAPFSTISPATLVAMAKIAHDTLRAHDPKALLFSPNITPYGLAHLDDYLRLGGGQWIDGISYHQYMPLDPELGQGLVSAVRSVMRNHKLDSLPLWNTEGSGGSGGDSADRRGHVLRSFLELWLAGVPNYGWYGWDLYEPLATPEDQINATGRAYATASRWLTGSQILSKSQDASGVVRVALTLQGQTPATLLWHPSQTLRIPTPTGAGNALLTMTDDSLPLPPDSIAVSPQPILLTTLAQIPTNMVGTKAGHQTLLRWQSNGTLHVQLARASTGNVRWRWYQLDGRALMSPKSQNLSGATAFSIPAPQGNQTRILRIESAGLSQTFVVPAQELSGK